LVKNEKHLFNPSSENRDIKNSTIPNLSGKLEDLLPFGIRTIYENKYFSSSEGYQALILSGSYPQPGWGVLISSNHYNHIIDLLENSIEEVNPNIRSVFVNGSENFNAWQELKNNEPQKSNTRELIKIKEKHIEVNVILNNILEEHKMECNNIYYFILLKNIYDKSSSYLDLTEDFNSIFKVADASFNISMMILKLKSSKILEEHDIVGRLLKFINEHNLKTNNLYKVEGNQEIRNIASLMLKLDQDKMPKKDFITWAQSIYESRIKEIIGLIEFTKSKLDKIIGNLEIKIRSADKEFNSSMEMWAKEVENKRLSFHKSLQEVIKNHIECGPEFLTRLEMRSKSGISMQSVSWDPPRMIGWKLLAQGIEIENYDMKTHIIEMFPEFSEMLNDEIYNDDSLINGSLFTDYIHYISTKDTKQNPRVATKNLLEKLLRPSQIKKILEKFKDKQFSDQTKSELIERLLVTFGWPEKTYNKVKKMAECIDTFNGQTSINKTIDGKEIRIICESFCKDFIDLLSSKIGYDESELLMLMQKKYPTYNSKKQSWNSILSYLTVENARFILEVLINEAYPEKAELSRKIIQNLINLKNKLNPLHHDPPLPFNTEVVLDEILNLLKFTKELISEMPWHFYPIQRYGYQPTVLTGDAWSHSHKQNRQLSIILWSDDNNSESMLVWNPSKLNPVIPDPQIIRRP
jgi:hypothetical protein